MEKIRWCMKLKDGIRLEEPNENLSAAYIEKAEKSLQATSSLKGNREWSVSTSYYSMYFALYSILVKIGIKCEVHACTIEFMKRFLSKYFTQDECRFLEKSMKARIDAQYYVNRTISEEHYRKMLEKAPSFLVKCKQILSKINEKEIMDIRKKIKKSNI